MNGIAGTSSASERGDGAEHGDDEAHDQENRQDGGAGRQARTPPSTRPNGIHSNLKRSRNGRNTAQKTTLKTKKTTPTTHSDRQTGDEQPSQRNQFQHPKVRDEYCRRRVPDAVIPGCRTLWPGICWEAMSEAEIPQVDPATVDASAAEDTPIIHPKAAPIESRFLYVDVAALRAKQLRRGARPRLDQVEEADPGVEGREGRARRHGRGQAEPRPVGPPRLQSRRRSPIRGLRVTGYGLTRP